MINEYSSPLASSGGAGARTSPVTQNQIPQMPKQGLDTFIKDESEIGASKWALLGVGALSVFAPMAHAAPQAQIQTIKNHQDQGTAKPQATYVLPGTKRVELYKPAGGENNFTNTGVDLGHGLLLESNGALSLVLESGSTLNDFQELENTDGGALTTHVTRDGNTVRAEGPTGRHVNIESDGNSLFMRSHEGFYSIAGGGGENSTFISGHVGHPGHGNQSYQIDWKGNAGTVTLPGGQRLEVMNDGQNATVRNGNTTTEYKIAPHASSPQDARIRMDQPFQVATENKDLQAFKAQLEKVEPGFVKSHPLRMALAEYALKNADFVDMAKGNKALSPLEVAVPAAGVVTGVAVGEALVGQSEALGMGAKAMGLKATAMSLAGQAYGDQAGAIAALHAGNIPQAMNLGHQAQVLGAQAHAVAGQAQSLGNNAMKIGAHASHAAHVAQTASIVGGGVAIVDGLITGYQGFKQVDTVRGALQAVSTKYQQIAEEENSQSYRDAKADFESLTPILLKMAKHADVTLDIGGAKIGCGALTLGSAFMGGPVAPIVAGAVGTTCYLGTAIYDHFRD